MDILSFVRAVLLLRARFVGMSITSWGRSISHNLIVGGVSNSKHLAWLAVDVVWDAGKRPGAVELGQACGDVGLHLFREDSHDHLEAAHG